jgi:hypothetical protein
LNGGRIIELEPEFNNEFDQYIDETRDYLVGVKSYYQSNLQKRNYLTRIHFDFDKDQNTYF